MGGVLGGSWDVSMTDDSECCRVRCLPQFPYFQDKLVKTQTLGGIRQYTSDVIVTVLFNEWRYRTIRTLRVQLNRTHKRRSTVEG